MHRLNIWLQIAVVTGLLFIIMAYPASLVNKYEDPMGMSGVGPVILFITFCISIIGFFVSHFFPRKNDSNVSENELVRRVGTTVKSVDEKKKERIKILLISGSALIIVALWFMFNIR